ncbi:MAG: DNA-formamidopyrimidine glycosylase family protein [Patulibacter sp.]
MPELPEVEAARALAERWTVGRTIVAADDADEWVCRPHPPGEIVTAIVGRRVESVERIGKSMWIVLDDGLRLGLHLGMAGRLVGLAPEGSEAERHALGDAAEDEDGDAEQTTVDLSPGGAADVTGTPLADAHRRVTRLDPSVAAAAGLPDTAGEPLTARERSDWSMPVRKGSTGIPGEGSWSRFTIELDDGGRLVLFDKRRLGRVRLNPDLSGLGPDALLIDEDTFVERVGRGALPLKARLMDQATIAGIGNLLCDEILWQAEQPPLRPASDLSEAELRELHGIAHACTREAMVRGGVHLGDVIEHRKKGEHCPRCGAEMVRATVGGRTTWWCSFEQAWPPVEDD